MSPNSPNDFSTEDTTSKFLKSELIRKNLLSRRDLMTFYKPQMVIEDNPFTNRTIINRQHFQAHTSNGKRNKYFQNRTGSQKMPRINETWHYNNI